MNKYLYLAALALVTGCAEATPGLGPTPEVNDPCVGAGGELDVSISVSADSAPLISWVPADCAVSSVTVRHWVPGVTCSPFLFGELCFPNSYPIWTVGSDAPGAGPAVINSPVRFGEVPLLAHQLGTLQPPALGDTVLVELIRFIPETQGIAFARTANLVIGTGLMP